MQRSLAVGLRAARSITLSILLLSSPQIFAATCESLSTLKLPSTTITFARTEQGDLSSLDNKTPGPPLRGLPPFCRVAGTISPVPDSAIGFEIWMPASNWNHRFLESATEASPEHHRFISWQPPSAMDTPQPPPRPGHRGDAADGSFALGHPEKVIDFGYRSEHETAVKAKTIIAAFYGEPQKRSDRDGCSSGGKQGQLQAQRYPDDFDGIIAGAPANHWEHLLASTIWIEQATHLTPVSSLPKEKLAILHQAALDACDASDGVKDGVIRDPVSCHFDPAVTQCKGTDTSACLSPEQVEAARKIYAGPVNPRTHEKIFPGLEPGSEITWYAFATPVFPIGASHFRYIVFKDPKWDPSTLNFDTDIAIAEKVDSGTLTATNPNLKPFFAHGGKLILYHGLSDGLIAPQNTVNYYNAVLKATGPRRPPPRASTLPPVWGTATAVTAPTHSISTHPSPPGSKTTRLPDRSSPFTSRQTLHPPNPTALVPSAPIPRSQSTKAQEAPTTPLTSPAQSREFYLTAPDANPSSRPERSGVEGSIIPGDVKQFLEDMCK